MAYPIGNATDVLDVHAALHNAVIDAKAHFSAVGDDSADDTAELQAAINAAQGLTTAGAEVVVGPGIFKITSALSITERITLVGTGSSTIIKQYTAGADALSFDCGSLSHVGPIVKDLQISGVGGGTARYGLRFFGANEHTMVSMENLLVNGFTTQLYIESAGFDGTARNCAFEFGNGTSRGVYQGTGRLVLEKPWFEAVTTGFEGFGASFTTMVMPKFTGDVTTKIVATDNLGFRPAISIIGADDMALPSVASAATLSLKATGHDFILVTGTTTITSIEFDWPGRVVTLKFAGALTFTDGSNLKLNGNFVTTADDTITLVCDGTNWYEVGRSAN